MRKSKAKFMKSNTEVQNGTNNHENIDKLN
jgi:hypothetical protein